ncbi:uncharacterized protein YndB with AHSA1/START domain [Branchiibius hedensis]|uniref:Uncharacterized conserved protein YndB, AHSA1/START domain n=1 Tax=Branchiibius hedensis TaxID=672460 RepID=A0A2Y8ZYQ4_9MICO|nr:SRPBCC family protein [Branchiibius hedensis]PWJ26537.1 uncharacterized protein YndB with AHSA1/START domain [Branchiibius hedensis]SSA35349.1 Uncharacterized conserved protein YndB, AHSA1/START domain [Branchiibius hedensis]
MKTAPALLSSIIEYGDRVTIRVHDVYPTTIEDLWQAVTEPERLARWMGTVSGDLRVGGVIHVTFTSSWDGPAVVETCEPPYAFSLRMDPGTEQETRIDVRLREEAGGTRLTVQDCGLPRADQLAHGAGWQVHLEDLRSALSGQDPAPWRPRWEGLMPTYARELGEPSAQPRLLGTLHNDGARGSIRLQERYATDRDDLWSALTEKDRLARWLGEFEGTLAVGQTYRYRMYASGAEGEDTITECDPPHRFVTTSSDGRESVEVTLTPDGEDTVLTVEHRGLPVDMVGGYGAGTQIHLEDLGAYVAGLGRCDSDARMSVLYPAYQELPVTAD